jgi:hypothetical protein
MSALVRLPHVSIAALVDRVLSVVVALLAIALAALIAMSYFGHSPSPYGTCYGSTGRSVPCAAIGR